MPWSKWIEEGFYINFLNLENVREYHKVNRRSFAHLEWEFGYPDKDNEDRVVPPNGLKGPYIPGGTDVIMQSARKNVLHQIIHGHKPQCLVYREWPGEHKRHGFPKKPWHNSELREVAHFTMEMSPFNKPSFITQFFMLKDVMNTIDFSIYNPSDQIPILPRFNFMAAKLELEKIGEVKITEDTGAVQTSEGKRYRETLDRLWRGLMYSKPISFAFPKNA